MRTGSQRTLKIYIVLVHTVNTPWLQTILFVFPFFSLKKFDRPHKKWTERHFMNHPHKQWTTERYFMDHHTKMNWKIFYKSPWKKKITTERLFYKSPLHKRRTTAVYYMKLTCSRLQTAGNCSSMQPQWCWQRHTCNMMVFLIQCAPCGMCQRWPERQSTS